MTYLPLPILGFAGRAEMLALWDRLDAADQQSVLMVARELAEARMDGVAPDLAPLAAEDVPIPAAAVAQVDAADVAYELERAIAREVAEVVPAIRTGKR